MGVKEDAGELLVYLYKRYLEGEHTNQAEVIKETQWNANRINVAFNYLKDLGTLKCAISLGNDNGVHNFFVHGLNPAGIDFIENKKQFKTHFNHTIDLKLYKFSWGREEVK